MFWWKCQVWILRLSQGIYRSYCVGDRGCCVVGDRGCCVVGDRGCCVGDRGCCVVGDRGCVVQVMIKVVVLCR